MGDLMFYGASDDLIEFMGPAIVDGKHVDHEEFTLPSGDEALLLLIFEDLSMGVHISYRAVTNGIWSLAPVVLDEGRVLPWRVSIVDGASLGMRYPGDYTMVLTVHDVPEGVTVVGPEYDGD